MDALDNYKKYWNYQSREQNQFSAIEIYKMARLKSSSIVKWIFIIGLLEFVILNSIYFFIDTDKVIKEFEKLGLESFFIYSQIVSYAILFYFLWAFYQNYNKISTIDSTKKLMKKIIKTRKTVRNYVLFNLGYMALVTLVIATTTINIDSKDLNTKQLIIFIISTLIAIVLVLGLLWLFYQLLYGFLLRKLNRNYKELAELDVLHNIGTHSNENNLELKND